MKEILRLMPTGFINGFGLGLIISKYHIIGIVILCIGVTILNINNCKAKGGKR